MGNGEEMELILLCMLVASMLANMGFVANTVRLHMNPLVKTEYKEIEVIKRAICECSHESSKHDNKGCRQQMFKLDGHSVNKSYECYCVKYVGPTPMSEYFDDALLQLESKHVRDL